MNTNPKPSRWRSFLGAIGARRLKTPDGELSAVVAAEAAAEKLKAERATRTAALNALLDQGLSAAEASRTIRAAEKSGVVATAGPAAARSRIAELEDRLATARSERDEVARARDELQGGESGTSEPAASEPVKLEYEETLLGRHPTAECRAVIRARMFDEIARQTGVAPSPESARPRTAPATGLRGRDRAASSINKGVGISAALSPVERQANAEVAIAGTFRRNPWMQATALSALRSGAAVEQAVHAAIEEEAGSITRMSYGPGRTARTQQLGEVIDKLGIDPSSVKISGVSIDRLVSAHRRNIN
jgi:hypothetical protein